MLTQTLRRAAPSANLMIPATGIVCPSRNAEVAKASISGSDAQTFADPLACQARTARSVAKAIMLTLNNICSGLNLLPGFGQHCTTVDTHATRTASTALRFATANSRNGRLTDMLPLIPGSLTFIREVAAASTRMTRQ